MTVTTQRPTMLSALFLLLAHSVQGFGTVIHPGLNRLPVNGLFIGKVDDAALTPPQVEPPWHRIDGENEKDNDNWVTDAFNTQAEWLEDIRFPVLAKGERTSKPFHHVDWFDAVMADFHPIPLLMTYHGLEASESDRRPCELFSVAMADFSPKPLHVSHKNTINDKHCHEWFTQAMQDTPKPYAPVGMNDFGPHHHESFKPTPQGILHQGQACHAFKKGPNEWFSQAIA